jgi:hypothetical protein
MKSFSDQLIDDIKDKQTEDMFNDGVKDRHYASTVPEVSRIYLKKCLGEEE